jgi:hypothetical protein
MVPRESGIQNTFSNSFLQKVWPIPVTPVPPHKGLGRKTRTKITAALAEHSLIEKDNLNIRDK